MGAIATVGCATAPPGRDAFYEAPATTADTGRPGDLLRSAPLPGAPPGARAWKVLFRSTGLDGTLIALSGVVIAPDGPAPDAGRPVVAWAHPTTGVAVKCAPSIRNEGVFRTIPELSALVQRGWVVVAPDYAGLGTAGPHPYLVGVSEGRALLDAVRAARQLPGAQAGSRFTVWGHSQGGHAVLFAGELWQGYAPEMKLLGVAAISAPTNIEQNMRDDLAATDTRDALRGRVVAAYSLWSWSRVYGAPLDGFVTPSAIPAIDRVAQVCLESLADALHMRVSARSLPAGFVAPEVYTTEPWKRKLVENQPGRVPVGAPIYIAQGTEDIVVRPSLTEDFVDRLCRRGELVMFDRLVGVAHLKAGRESAPTVIRWMEGRFAGAPAPNTCPAR